MKADARVCPHCGRKEYDRFIGFLAMLGLLALISLICLIVLL